MTRNVHILESDPDVRIIAEATSLDLVAYRSWTASMTRERKETASFLGWDYTTWTREDPIPEFSVEWQDGAGNLINSPPAVDTSTGYRSVSQFSGFLGGPEPEVDPVSNIESMRMTYQLYRLDNLETIEIVVGRNWITFVAVIVVIIIVVVILVVIFGPWWL